MEAQKTLVRPKYRQPITNESTWGSTFIVFLGIVLDGEHHILAITEEKRLRMLNTLLEISDRKKATVRELQALTGLLNFLTRAIFPGRAFTRRMYAKFTGENLGKLKQHHHIRLDQEFKSDCRMWIDFLSGNTSVVSRPFVDLSQIITAEELCFFTDAAKKLELGMGGIYDRHWFFAKWEEGFIQECDPSIEYLELLGVCTGVFIWGRRHLMNKRIVVFCDNQSVVVMVNNTASKCRNCMNLIRKLTLYCLQINTRVFAKWVMGAANTEADMLSRQKITQFKQYTSDRGMDEDPEHLPLELWPVSKICMK